MSQTALVTGATSGIGESLCLLFASDGYDLVTVARDEEALEKQADELRILGVDVLPVACDLSDPDSARTIFKRVCKAGKDIDILVNDAGYSPAGQFSDLPVADIRAMIQVSVTSLAELTRVFLQPMLERGHGRILNMSSMMAKTPCPYNALYGAAKVFVLSFSTALARELRGTGVSVTTACPGATRTNFAKNAGIEGAPAWKYFSMSTDETAIRVYRALMRGELCAVTGWYNKVGAVSVRFMPMGVQLSAGEWLMGKRKHPLDHEGAESSDARNGKGKEHGEGKDGRDGRDGEKKAEQREGGASGKGGKRYERKHPLGRDGKRGFYRGGDSGTDHEPEPWPKTARPQNPCGGGRGWRAATLGCAMFRQHGSAAAPGAPDGKREPDGQGTQARQDRQQAQQPQNPQRGQARGGGFHPAPGHHHGPTSDGLPANLGRFAWHGPFSK